MDVFQGLPSNSVPLCLTSWENLNKSANTSEKNSGSPQVWFILGNNFQTPEGTTFICTNNSTKYKHHGTPQRSYCSGRRRILSPRYEYPRTTATDLVKMLEETGTKVSISTVKCVLYQHNLKGCSARKKPLLQNRHKKSQTTVCNCTYFLEKCPLVG